MLVALLRRRASRSAGCLELGRSLRAGRREQWFPSRNGVVVSIAAQ